MNQLDIARLAGYPYQYVGNESELLALCDKLKQASVLTLDTEFVRTRTLKPQLGLLQVFDGKELALIDPVSIKDLSAFTALLENEGIVKVLHSCSEDIDALYNNLGVVPKPLFDTQFAASLLGKGASLGYANLIESLFSVALDKGESRTDWMARPLSSKQLDYAAADVTYLMAAYDELVKELESLNLSHCVFSESEQLIQKKTHLFPSDYAYLLVSNNWKLNARSLYALKHLSKWRLELARRDDVAINFVIKEAAMLEIAMKLPASISQLHQMHAMFGKQIRLYGQDIIDICEQAKLAEPKVFPDKPQRLIEFSQYKRAMADIKTIVEKVEAQHGIPAAVLASKKQIGQLLKWCWFELDETELHGLTPDLISPWRRDLFIDDLSSLFSQDKDAHSKAKYHAMRSL